MLSVATALSSPMMTMSPDVAVTVAGTVTPSPISTPKPICGLAPGAVAATPSRVTLAPEIDPWPSEMPQE